MNDQINGLNLVYWFAAAAVALGIGTLAKAMFDHQHAEPQGDLEVQAAMEKMRQILERDTGREIAVVYRAKGYWWAQTARGPVRVDDLLRDGYVRVGVK